MRTVNHGRYQVRRPWPEGAHLSGGSSGLVLSRLPGVESYTTAFFEYSGEETFIRGEGDTIREAEDAAWQQRQAQVTCPQHEYETRGYRSGAGFCQHCNRFESGVFDVREVGHPCNI
ncbi:MAG TPA: hypothetical protein VK054_05825, partial [Beutenbergiaceae bacterium]|nr:hypothetical protein [Beutenbergiaceae bacterium]